MKKLLVAIIVFGIVSCDNSDSSKVNSGTIEQEWNFISSTGGGGPQCFYDRGEKIYTFTSAALIVVDNYFDDDICNQIYKSEGQYSYEVRVVEEDEYLFIDDQEQGRVRFEDGDLFIETWLLSGGDVIDDLPTYRLEL